jgi:aspartate/methionine/tyrosine aminotransferase
MHFGQPTTGAPPSALAAAHFQLDRDPLGYWESMPLQERIARHYAEAYGVNVAPERILLTLGASAALTATFAALFGIGDRVAVLRPGYPAYRNTLLALGREPLEIDCGAAQGFRLTPESLVALNPAPAGLVLASPANPTGAMYDRRQLAGIAGVCARRGIRLISDEIYHGITYTQRGVCALEVHADAVVINSFSKLYRMPGWRLGWMLAPESLVAKLHAYLINMFLTPPALAQHAALAAFEDAENLEAAVSTYRRNRELLLEALPKLGIKGIAPPDGAFYIYADIGHLTQDSLAFCMQLVEETGVSLAPGIDFDPVHGRRFVRMSFAVSTNEVERALERLETWLRSRR